MRKLFVFDKNHTKEEVCTPEFLAMTERRNAAIIVDETADINEYEIGQFKEMITVAENQDAAIELADRWLPICQKFVGSWSK